MHTKMYGWVAAGLVLFVAMLAWPSESGTAAGKATTTTSAQTTSVVAEQIETAVLEPVITAYEKIDDAPYGYRWMEVGMDRGVGAVAVPVTRAPASKTAQPAPAKSDEQEKKQERWDVKIHLEEKEWPEVAGGDWPDTSGGKFQLFIGVDHRMCVSFKVEGSSPNIQVSQSLWGGMMCISSINPIINAWVNVNQSDDDQPPNVKVTIGDSRPDEVTITLSKNLRPVFQSNITPRLLKN